MTYVVQTPPASEPLTVAEVKAHCRIDQSNQELAPGAIDAALASPAAAGNVDDGVHRYRATFVTADGETEGGEISGAVTVADKTVNGQIELTNIPIGGGLVTARKIYRTEAGGSNYLLLATISDNTTTSYTDNIADSALGAAAPATNTTEDPALLALIKAARRMAEKELGRYLITQTIDAYYDDFPECFRLPPLQSVTSIVYTDTAGSEQTLATSQYVVDASSIPARITEAYAVSWPSTYDIVNAVRVRFVAGYGDAADVPQNIKIWMLQYIKQLYDHPSPTIGGNATQQQRAYVDGLLDDERVYGL